jgi:hypothetical protein
MSTRTSVASLALTVLAIAATTPATSVAKLVPRGAQGAPQRSDRDGPAGGSAPPGSIVVTFVGSGSGSYRYSVSPGGNSLGEASCTNPAVSYSERDSYAWRFTFMVAHDGGVLAGPLASQGSGLLSATTAHCASALTGASSCSLQLTAPTPADSDDLDYPDVNVTVTGSHVTVAVIGELVPSPKAAGCGGGAYQPSPVVGFNQLQANVTLSRSALERSGHVSAPFTMAGSGLFAGVALSGACDGLTCQPQTCEDPAASPGGSTAACSYDETYAGTVEVRVNK